MIVPLLAIAAGLGGVYAYSRKGAASPAAAQLPAASPPAAPELAKAQVAAVLDAHMPAPARAAIAQAVVESTDAKQLATFAAKVQTEFPIAAAVVATRAKQLVTAVAAAVGPAPSAQPSQGDPGDRMYTVAKGDNPTAIGKKLTGRSDAAMVRELAASNPTIATRITAGDLRVGEKVKIPSSWIGTPVPSDTPLVTSATYAVQKGDSPSGIAKKLTGQGTAAKVNELAAANASKKARILKGDLQPYSATTGKGDLLVIPEAWRK